jgi:hypothetical protein
MSKRAPSTKELRITPWTCEFCYKPIAPGDGAIELRGRDEHGTIHGYPTDPTSDDGIFASSPLQIIAWLRGRVAMTVTHYECDPNRGASSFRIGIESALTLEQWCAWALHLHQKSWMGKRDSFLFMELWFTNRKIDYSDLTLSGLAVRGPDPAASFPRLQLRQ